MYKVYDDRKLILETEDLQKAQDKAMELASKYTKHYIRFWVNENILTIDYGSHHKFIRIVSDNKDEEMNLTINIGEE